MKKIIYGALLLTPVLASAAGFDIFITLIQQLGQILRLLIPMAFGLAILYFFYGIAKYVLAAGDPEKAKEGKSIMIYGVIALAVMVALFGLITWLANLFGINAAQGTIQPPNIQGF